MPTFDFRCTACKTPFEAVIPFGSKEYPPCPTCGNAAEKLLTPPLGIVFKGRGFYKTDSAAPTAEKSAAPAEEPKAATTEEKSSPPSKKPEKAV